MKSPILAWVAIVSLTTVGLVSPAAAATDLTGSTVTGELFYPNLASPIAPPVAAVVGPGIEFPAFSLGPSWFATPFTVDVTGDKIIIAAHYKGTIPVQAFNGFVLTFIGAPAIADVTLDPASTTISGANHSGFTANSISIDGSGAIETLESVTILDITFAAVPEPTTWAMMLAGFLGMALMIRAARNRRGPALARL